MVLSARCTEPSTQEATYTIGDLARRYNVSLRTLRFYEDVGLLAPERKGATRCYRALDRVRLELVLTGKRLGFTLAEIAELIAGRHDETDAESTDLPAVLSRDQLARQIEVLERRRIALDDAIAELRRARQPSEQQSVAGDGHRGQQGR